MSKFAKFGIEGYVHTKSIPFCQFSLLIIGSNSSATLYEHRTAKKSQIFSSAYLAAVYLSRDKNRKKVFCFGSPAMREELTSLGVDHFGLVFWRLIHD